MTGFDGATTIAVNGTSLAYQERGQGDVVLFVHGSASDMRTWHRQLPAFGSSWRAVAYSRRFARPNDDIGEGADDPMMPHVADLVAFVRSAGLGRVHLVGHSWGAFVCLLTALRYPDVVNKLVLMEPPVLTLFVSMPPGPLQLLRLLVTRPRLAGAIVKFGTGTVSPAQRAYRRGDDDAAMEIFGRGVLGDAAFEGLSAERLAQVRANRRADKAQLMGAGFPPLAAASVRTIQAPTLLLHGDRSPMLFGGLTRELERLIPDAICTEIPQASHLMHEDNPERVNALIQEFLAAPADRLMDTDLR